MARIMPAIARSASASLRSSPERCWAISFCTGLASAVKAQTPSESSSGVSSRILDASQNACLDMLTNDGRGVVARLLAAACRASIPIPANDNVSASTAAAVQKAAEDEPGSMGSIEGVACLCLGGFSSHSACRARTRSHKSSSIIRRSGTAANRVPRRFRSARYQSQYGSAWHRSLPSFRDQCGGACLREPALTSE